MKDTNSSRRKLLLGLAAVPILAAAGVVLASCSGKCSACKGTGYSKAKCPECKGTGKAKVLGTYGNDDVTCPKCNGKGLEICKSCWGKGKR